MTASPLLKPHASIAPLPEGAPVLVCILDGWGAGAHSDKYNAVASADTPVVDKLSGVAGRYRTIKVSLIFARAWHGSRGVSLARKKRKTSSEVRVLEALRDPVSSPAGLSCCLSTSME